MTQTIFTISQPLIIVLLCLPLLFSNKYRFSSPATTGTWQYDLFWGLFLIFIIGLVWVSILDFNGSNGITFYVIGLPLLVFGIGLACYLSYIILGQTNSYGRRAELCTQSVYRWSKKAVYVETIVGMFGWELFARVIYRGTLA